MELRYGLPPPYRRPYDHLRSTAPTTSSSTFSSSLLDAIYRSMGDEPNSFYVDSRATINNERANAARSLRPAATLSCRYFHELSSPVRRIPAAEKQKFNDEDLREQYKFTAAVTRSARLTASSSSSSDGSSCTGFFSDDSSRLPTSVRLKPVRTGSNQLSRTDEKTKKQPPASPGARLASFISSLFSGAAGGGKKKHRRASATAGASTESCSSAPSFARSCMNISAATEEKKSVRFKAAAKGEGFLRRGLHGGKRAAAEELTKMGSSSSSSSSGGGSEEVEDEGSDGSSDLFELESLKVGRYTDELPVYGSTNLSKF